MDYVCSDCGYESDNPGNCPECETPLLRREDKDADGVGESGAESDEEGLGEGLGKDDEDDEEW